MHYSLQELLFILTNDPRAEIDSNTDSGGDR